MLETLLIILANRPCPLLFRILRCCLRIDLANDLPRHRRYVATARWRYDAPRVIGCQRIT